MDDLRNLRPLARWVRHGSFRIEDPSANGRLDRYLGQRFPYRSRTHWARMISEGRILVNGRRCRPSQVLTLGLRIDYLLERRPEPMVSEDFRVLHEDASLLAVDKPPNLPVHPSGRYYRNTLLLLLLEQRGENLDHPGIRIVHRLDRETSGIVLFGKSRAAARALARQFEDREVEKEYLLLVHGNPTEESFEVNGALGRKRGSKVRKAVGVVPQEEGRAASTRFQVVARGPDHALLVARPLTGRLHQIRVHASHAGFPVVGDKLYGLDENLFLRLAEGDAYSEEEKARLMLGRQALHAWRLTVRHPETGAPFCLTAPLPEDLAALCQRLGIALAELA